MKEILSIGIIAVFCVSLRGQQQALHTQFMYNKMAFNPAFAGHDQLIHFNLLYRTQWIGLKGAPTIQQLSVNMPFKVEKVGLGLNLARNTIGVSEMITLDGIYAYKIRMAAGMLSLGAQVSSRSISTDYSDPDLTVIDDVFADPAISSTKQRKQVFNMGLGAYYHTDRYFAGISVPRLLKSNIDFENNGSVSRESMHLILMGGAKFDLSQNTSITPQILLRWAENSPPTMDINGSAEFYDKFTAGLTFRTGGDSESIAESLDFIFSMEIKRRLIVGFAYDLTLSSLKNYQSGSIEILVHYNLEKKEKSQEFINPRFF